MRPECTSGTFGARSLPWACGASLGAGETAPSLARMGGSQAEILGKECLDALGLVFLLEADDGPILTGSVLE